MRKTVSKEPKKTPTKEEVLDVVKEVGKCFTKALKAAGFTIDDVTSIGKVKEVGTNVFEIEVNTKDGRVSETKKKAKTEPKPKRVSKKTEGKSKKR